MNATIKIIKLLNTARTSTTDVSHWATGMAELTQSIVLEVAKELAKPQVIDPQTPHYVEAQAAEFNRILGVNEVLDLLYGYQEMLSLTKPATSMPPEFGGTDAAINNQDLTEEEVNAIRNNTAIPQLKRQPVPDYSARYSSEDDSDTTNG